MMAETNVTYDVVFDQGFALVGTVDEVLALVNAKEGIQCMGHPTMEQAYIHGCKTYVERFWGLVWPQILPMPTIDFFIQNKVFQHKAPPPWNYRHHRYFAVLTSGLNAALLCEVEGLAGYLCNEVPMLMAEFGTVEDAKNWLKEQIFIAISIMGAYIHDMGPVTIPDAGTAVPGCAPTLFPDADRFLSPGSLLSEPSNIQNPAYLQGFDFTGGMS